MFEAVVVSDQWLVCLTVWFSVFWCWSTSPSISVACAKLPTPDITLSSFRAQVLGIGSQIKKTFMSELNAETGGLAMGQKDRISFRSLQSRYIEAGWIVLSGEQPACTTVHSVRIQDDIDIDIDDMEARWIALFCLVGNLPAPQCTESVYRMMAIRLISLSLGSLLTLLC